ncbi:hypothetical protein ACOQFL_02480 [Actinopolyspora sp. H202]|uniref:GHMP family kinase ATP-binding protein n=1 Tax=Actinopolyspora sp. H202 TaxID=1500456 RepID=UPI003EE4D2A5
MQSLVTLPCTQLNSTVEFAPSTEESITSTISSHSPVSRNSVQKVTEAARLTLANMGIEHLGGQLTLDSNIPSGRGCGSSTADVVAAIRAIADALGTKFSPETIGQVAVSAELASDALMFDQPVLFAQLRGTVIENFYPAKMPSFTVVAWDRKPNSNGIDTLAQQRPTVTNKDVDSFAILRSGLRRAIGAGDSRLLGSVASASTRQYLWHHPDDVLQEILAAVSSWGGFGVQVAHSGTVAGILAPRCQKTVERIRSELAQFVSSQIWSFDVRS